MPKKINLNAVVRPKVFWPSIIILLILSITFYGLKEKEKSLRIAKEKELQKTVEAKMEVENNLLKAKKEIAKRDEQIRLALENLERETNVRKKAEAQLIAIVEAKRTLEEKYDVLVASLPKYVELEKIVVKSQPELTGRVLVYDKENSFIIVDLGSENNLKLGNVLSVYRDDKFLGRTKVERLEDRTAAAIILPGWRNIEFQINDTVKKL